MFKQIKVISVLISLVALGCTDAKPDFAVLSSSFSGPTFSGNGSLTLNINSGSDSVSIAGECDTKILSLQWSFNGTTFVTVDPDDINSGSDLSCADGNFNLQIDDISTLLPGMVPGNTRNIYVRGVNEFGPTAAGTITITYSSGPTVPDATTSSIDILTTSVQVSTGTLQASVKVILRTSDSLPVTGVTPTLSGYGTINETLPTCSASDPAGESICTFSSTQASAREIELATPVMVTTVGDIVTFTPGPANASVFHLEPGDTKSGQLFTQQPVIRVNDSFGNLVTGYSGTITLDTVPTGKLLGTVSRNAVSGVATFTDLRIDAAGTYTLTDTTFSANSSSLDIGPARLQIIGTLNNIIVNTCRTITVYSRDIEGTNTAVAANTTVNLSSDHPNITFYSDSACTAGNEINSLVLNAGSASRAAYFMATAAGGPYQMTASDSDSELAAWPRSDLQVYSAPIVTSVSTFPVCPAVAKVGDNISVQVVFSENVTVTPNSGNVTLALETGNTDVNVSYNSGTSGATVVRFTYTVTSGHSTSDLEYKSINALVLTSDAQITSDASGLSADLTLPAVASATSLSGTSNCGVDGNAPNIMSITAPANGIYDLSDTLFFEVQFDEAVNVTGNPQIPLTIGSNTVFATYFDQPTASQVRFSYLIVPGDNDHDGIATSTLIDLNSGSITDTAGNAASLTFSPPYMGGPPNLSGVWVNTGPICNMPFNAFNNMGDGTLSEPYIICNADQLNDLGLKCDNTNLACTFNYRLEADVNLGLLAPNTFTIIGSATYPFSGQFDGNGYTIRGLSYNDPGRDRLGLFGRTMGAKITNLQIENFAIVGGNIVGALIGEANIASELDGIRVINGNVDGAQSVGGMVGQSVSTSISHSFSTAMVSGGNDIGGLVGHLVSSTLSQSFVNGSVVGSINTGGLIGRLNSSDISDCYALGSVNGSGTSSAGLVGHYDPLNSSLSRCYAATTLTSNYGLIGIFATGSGSAVVDSYYDTTVSGAGQGYNGSAAPTPGITGMPTTWMQSSANFPNWDFVNVWVVTGPTNYPTLRQNPQP